MYPINYIFRNICSAIIKKEKKQFLIFNCFDLNCIRISYTCVHQCLMCCAIFVHLMCCVCVCVYLWKTNHPFVIVSPSYYFVILTWANISDDSMRPSNLEWTLLLRVLLSFFVFFCFCFGWFGLNCRASSILYCKYLISAHFTWLDVYFQNISIPKYLFTLKFIIVTPIYPQFFGVYISILLYI